MFSGPGQSSILTCNIWLNWQNKFSTNMSNFQRREEGGAVFVHSFGLALALGPLPILYIPWLTCLVAVERVRKVLMAENNGNCEPDKQPSKNDSRKQTKIYIFGGF
jgi:hypothetical protein